MEKVFLLEKVLLQPKVTFLLFHILMPYNIMKLYFSLPYFRLSNSDRPARRDNTLGSLTPTIHTQSCLIPYT